MKEYLPFDPASGYLAKENLFYECQTCAASVPSLPPAGESAHCVCGNIQVDTDAGRISFKDLDTVKLFSLT